MIRSSGAGGFEGHSAAVASSRLIDAVATALAIGSLSLCLIVTLTVFSIKVSMAMPIPAQLRIISPGPSKIPARKFLRDKAP